MDLADKLLSKIDLSIQKISFLPHNQKKYIVYFLALVCFLFMLHLNKMVYMWSDDYSYTFIYGTDQRIESISDIIYSQYLHYMAWGGRSVAHFIAQFLLTLDLFWADVLNSFAYVLLVGVIYLHAKGREQSHNISLFILINLFMWFFQPAFAETMLWITGSANYLWCTLIILLFLLPYRLYNNQEYSKIKAALLTLIMFVSGVIAGWTNENVVVAVALILVFWMFLFREEKWRIPLWAIVGFIGLIIGFLFLILAPGNYVRLEAAGEPPLSLFRVYFKFNMATVRLVDNAGLIFLLSLILLILVLKFSSLPNKKSYLKVLFIYALGIFIPVYAMIPSPQFPNRAWFGLMIFAFIFFGAIFYQLNVKLRFIRFIRYSILSLFLVGFIFNFYKSYKEIKHVRDVWVDREAVIQKAIQNESDTVAIQGIDDQSKYVLRDGGWTFSVMSKYYGLEIEDINVEK